MKHDRDMLNVYRGRGFVKELEHFHICQHCGQAVDMRLLGDVLYHDDPDHEPLKRQ